MMMAAAIETIIKEELFKLLTEGRAEQAMAILGSSGIVQSLMTSDPTPTKKYVIWMAKMVRHGADPEEVV